MSEEIYKPYDFYYYGRINLEMSILKDGHTMLWADVTKDLNNYRRGFYTEKAKREALQGAISKMKSIALDSVRADHKSADLALVQVHAIAKEILEDTNDE
jgi:hypothetical protein